MMPQPPQQRPARMPSGPSPAMGGGMPNRPDRLRQQAEQTLPSMPPMGNEPMAEDGPGEQDLVVGIAMTANEIAGGEPRRAIAMLDQAKDLLMQQVGSEDGEGAGEPDMGRLAEILGGEMMA